MAYCKEMNYVYQNLYHPISQSFDVPKILEHCQTSSIFFILIVSFSDIKGAVLTKENIRNRNEIFNERYSNKLFFKFIVFEFLPF